MAPPGDRGQYAILDGFCRRQIDDGAHVGVVTARVAKFNRVNSGQKLAGKHLFDVAVQIEPLHGRAALPGDFEAMADRGCHSLVDVGVGHHEERVIAAKLHQAANETRGILERQARDWSTGKRQQVDGRARQIQRRIGSAIDVLEQAARPASLFRQLS